MDETERTIAFRCPAAPPIAVRTAGDRWKVYRGANGYAINQRSGRLTVVYENYAMGTQTLATFPREGWFSLTTGAGAAVPSDARPPPHHERRGLSSRRGLALRPFEGRK